MKTAGRQTLVLRGARLPLEAENMHGYRGRLVVSDVLNQLLIPLDQRRVKAA